MITSKELKYVDIWPSKIPMPGVEYSIEVLKNIKDCLETWKEKYKDKEYNIICSSGEELNFKIFDYNLCHMFGIDYKNIRNEFFSKYRRNILSLSNESFTSFELLNAILDNFEKVAELDNDVENRVKIINYYKSAIKCEIFNKLSDFEHFNYGILNVESLQKLFFVPSNESICPYFVMGLKMPIEYKDNIENQFYTVSTLLAPSSPKDLFENKEVVIPTQMLISDNYNLKKISATAEEKIRLLTMYKNIVNKYKIPFNLNTFGDYEAMLNEIANQLILKRQN